MWAALRWPRFADSQTERRFREGHGRRALFEQRLGLIVAALLTMAFAPQDPIISPENGLLVLTIRVFISVPVTLLAFALTFTPLVPRFGEIVLLMWSLGFFAVSSVILILLENEQNYGFSSIIGQGNLLLFSMAACVVLRFRFQTAVVFGVAVLVQYAAISLTYASYDIDYFFGGPFVNMVIGISLAITYNLAREMADRRAFANDLKIQEIMENTLPPRIVERIKRDEHPIIDAISEVTIIFVDLVNFTALTRLVSPGQLVEILDDLYSRFDAICDANDVEKIKTIGDAYMAASGMKSDSTVTAVRAALDMTKAVDEVAHAYRLPISARIGLHTGSAVAGVLGRKRYTYDVWGEAVNIAEQVQSTCEQGRVQISETTNSRVQQTFKTEMRGEVIIKAGQVLRTYYVLDEPPQTDSGEVLQLPRPDRNGKTAS